MNGNGHDMVRAIRGPVILITMGALFALNNFTNWDFSRTWPVLLIVIGLMSLAGRSVARRQPPAAPPPPPPPYSYPPPPRADYRPPQYPDPSAGPGNPSGGVS
jgi:hypothetical protein